MDGLQATTGQAKQRRGHRIASVSKLRSISFGTPAAIVTSMGLIVGLDAATAAKGAVVASLLITGIADNLTNFAQRPHLSRSSEEMAERQAFRTTVANFISRLTVSSKFYPVVSSPADTIRHHRLRHLGIPAPLGTELSARKSPRRQRTLRDSEARKCSVCRDRHRQGDRSLNSTCGRLRMRHASTRSGKDA